MCKYFYQSQKSEGNQKINVTFVKRKKEGDDADFKIIDSSK